MFDALFTPRPFSKKSRHSISCKYQPQNSLSSRSIHHFLAHSSPTSIWYKFCCEFESYTLLLSNDYVQFANYSSARELCTNSKLKITVILSFFSFLVKSAFPWNENVQNGMESPSSTQCSLLSGYHEWAFLVDSLQKSERFTVARDDADKSQTLPITCKSIPSKDTNRNKMGSDRAQMKKAFAKRWKRGTNHKGVEA